MEHHNCLTCMKLIFWMLSYYICCGLIYVVEASNIFCGEIVIRCCILLYAVFSVYMLCFFHYMLWSKHYTEWLIRYMQQKLRYILWRKAYTL